MAKKILLFAPTTFNLAETTRMIEIAKGIVNHEFVSKVFDLQFISDGGDFEHLIEKEGFALEQMEPRVRQEKIGHVGKVDQGQRCAPAFSKKKMIERIDNEIAYIKQIKPAAVITGSYLTIPIICRILIIPLVWVIQSTWLEAFVTQGIGMTDSIQFKPVKFWADRGILLFINFWIQYGFLNPVNQVARYFGVDGYKSIFEFRRGDMTLVAEPADFSGVKLPPNYYYTGPLVAKQDSPLPEEIRNVPRDRPIIYFAMESSGKPEIIANLIESFEGKPYRVIASVKNHLNKTPTVKIPSNVYVTDWLPAHQVKKLVDLLLIDGGIGTVITAALAGKPVVGVGMQPEQTAKLACLVRKGFAIQVPKSKSQSNKMQEAIAFLLNSDEAKRKAEEYSKLIDLWNGPQIAAELLYEKFG